MTMFLNYIDAILLSFILRLHIVTCQSLLAIYGDEGCQSPVTVQKGATAGYCQTTPKAKSVSIVSLDRYCAGKFGSRNIRSYHC